MYLRTGVCDSLLPRIDLYGDLSVKKSITSTLDRLKSFVVNNYKKLGKILLMVAALVALSSVSLLILSAFGIIYFEDGMQINMGLFSQFRNAWYGWMIIILVQVVITTLLCFIPGASMAFIMLLGAIYGENQASAFLIAFIGVMLSSLLMYFTGRFGGYAICTKLLGKEDCERASRLLNNRGVVFFPIMMLFPMFPDDALVMIAGTLKMSLKWFVPSIVVCRGIGIATIIFGLGNIPFDSFTTPWHWIAFISVCAIGIVAVFWSANKLSLYLEKRSAAGSNTATGDVAEISEDEVAEEITEEPVEETEQEPALEVDEVTEETADETLEEQAVVE